MSIGVEEGRTAAFDLEAYLARIGLKEPLAADMQGLLAIQRAHRLAIPFENLDALLDRPIATEPEAVFEKLVRKRRGGYCFEQNTLFLEGLRALGFEARPLLARVWLFAEDVPPKTHMILLVTISGREWIADAGFGGSYTPPMPLEEGEAESPDGARHRLRRDATHGWILERSHRAQGWEAQYSFTTAPVWPADIALANYYTSTAPDSRFKMGIFATIVLPNGFASLHNLHYRRSSGAGEEAGEINSARMLQLRLSLLFGIDLDNEEIEALGLFR